MISDKTGIPGEESRLVARLSLEQKVRLLTGADSWSLYAEKELGLRPIVMSDGPAGVRGIRFDAARPSSSLPCPVALAATWDEQLVHDVALALGHETRARGVDVLLAPTMNIVRTPLSGRGFECFSEDPLLTARMAVAYVRGVQGAGVAATAKHYVANDSETERRSYDVLVSERVLRELYLPPFEACVNEADVALVMAAYNSVNGAFMTANRPLLHDLLKTEWGFRGVVVSDWSATYTTVPSAQAGLDLVMPGPHGPWGDRLIAEVKAGTMAEADIDDKVARLIGLARRVGALNGSVDGEQQQSAGSRALVDPAVLREVTARSFVLLSNPRGLLPMRSGGIERLALIGPNAVEPQTQGGGSVRVLPVAGRDLAESLGEALDTYVSVHQGCITSATIAVPHDGSLRDPVSGEAGVRVEVRTADGAVVSDARFPTSVLTWWDDLPAAVHLPDSEVVMRARYRARVDGPHMLGVAGVGLLRVKVDGTLLAEAKTEVRRDSVQALSQPPEVRVPLQLPAGREVDVRVEHWPHARGPHSGFATLRLGIAPVQEDDKLMADAVVAAAGADVAVVVVGSADGTESEGYDRDDMALPGRQDELVMRVAAANPNTVVVVNSGTVEPGGRLPVSVPRAEADSPVLLAHPEAGDLVYGEGLLVGYRGYDRAEIEPLFCFGHGLGYADWTYETLAGPAESITEGQDVTLSVMVRNSGVRAGREVVQVYLEGPHDDPSRPLRVLAAFASVSARPGEQAEARLTVQARSFMRFDEGRREWVWSPGTYTLHAGRSSRDLRLKTQVVLR